MISNIFSQFQLKITRLFKFNTSTIDMNLNQFFIKFQITCQMPCQFALRWESLVAMFALERLICRMDNFVSLQALFEGKALVANITLEWPLLLMVLCVFLPLFAWQKWPFTVSAQKLRLIRMHFFVSSQQCRPWKCFSAHHTLEWFLSGVDQCMFAQIVFTEKSLIAHIALEFPIAHMIGHMDVQQLTQRKRTFTVMTWEYIRFDECGILYWIHLRIECLHYLRYNFNVSILVGLDDWRPQHRLNRFRRCLFVEDFDRTLFHDVEYFWWRRCLNIISDLLIRELNHHILDRYFILNLRRHHSLWRRTYCYRLRQLTLQCLRRQRLTVCV